MADTLIDCVSKKLDVADPDDSLPMTVQNATVVPGPGDTVAGKFQNAVARLNVSTILSPGLLGVSRIDRMFGPALEVRLIDQD
jgi:hypothetical protein